MRRLFRLIVIIGLAAATAASAQPGEGRFRADIPYDGRFTFVRLRWGGGGSGFFNRGMSSAWNHDYPRAEAHLAQILKEVTLIDIRQLHDLRADALAGPRP